MQTKESQSIIIALHFRVSPQLVRFLLLHRANWPFSLSSSLAFLSYLVRLLPSPLLRQGFEYGRSGNPTRNVLEECLASLDNGKYGMTFASGLGATTTIVSLLSAGDHILVTDDLYGGTSRLLRNVTTRMGIEPEFVDASNLELVERSIKSNTKMVWIETPTNPLMKVIDIEAVCKVAHKQPGVSFS